MLSCSITSVFLYLVIILSQYYYFPNSLRLVPAEILHNSTQARLNYVIKKFFDSCWVSRNLNNRKHIDAIFLDFSKAFDKVSHSKLCHKLFHYGINGRVALMDKRLSDRSQSVVLDGINSRPHPGVPQ